MSTEIVVHDDDSNDTAVPGIFGIPLNRIIAFGGPYFAVASGAVADWLLVHVHLLSLFHTTHNSLAGAITQGTVFGLTTLVVWLGHQKWLDGFQKWAYTTVVESTATNVINDVDGPAALPQGHDQPYEGGMSEREVESAQTRGFKAGGSGSRTDPTVPPGISREQRKE